ncbi:uncharacterized protein LOC129589812 [Paramacrobiotus metropolitanus]|uniref:uncharacterized protein LOC129589812 n=1 Tax=Paramacrobiotus metropolitanus TaxID=2943436 RepID=UPI002446457C|nr:uncharacterized protein LOC129589812 [Paramacrobiotus metropolitanus]
MYPFLFRNGIGRYSVELFLLYLSLVFNLGTGIIRVYKKDYGKTFGKPVCTLWNDYPAIPEAKFPVDRSVYLKTGVFDDACNLSKAPTGEKWRKSPKMILLMDDSDCGPVKNVLGSASSGNKSDSDVFYAKVLKAQEFDYVAAIVYPRLPVKRQRPSVSLSDPEKPTTSTDIRPYPIPVSDKMAKLITIPVHFVTYEQGMILKHYAHQGQDFATGFHFNLARLKTNIPTMKKNSYLSAEWSEFFRRHRKLIFLETAQTTSAYYGINVLTPRPNNAWSDDGRESPTIEPLPAYSTSNPGYTSQTANSLTIYFAVILSAGLVFALLFCACNKIRLRRQQRAGSRRFSPRTFSIPQNLTGEETAEVMAARRRLYGLCKFLVQEQEAQERERQTVNDIPLSVEEMEQLPRVEVTEPTDDVCPSCQQTFIEGDLKIVLSCAHDGHEACLTIWLTMFSRNCSVCQQPAFADGTAESTTNSSIVLTADTCSQGTE